MAKREIAYVPLDKTTPSVQAPTKIDIPTYPDAGVDYAGYSKTLLGGNQYKINPQQLFNHTEKFTAVVGTVSSSIGYPPEGKKLYITSLQLNTSITAVDANSYFKINSYQMGGGSIKTLFESALLRSETIDIQFSTPLVIEFPHIAGAVPSGCEIKFSSGAATLNVLTYNLQGWIE